MNWHLRRRRRQPEPDYAWGDVLDGCPVSHLNVFEIIGFARTGMEIRRLPETREAVAR